MATRRVTGIQMTVGPSKKDNLSRIIEYIEKSDCDYIVFPEMCLTGHNDGFSDTRTLEAWEQIAAACRLSYVTAIIGTGSRAEGRVYIQTRVFNDHGEVLGTHEKLVPTKQERKWCRAGGKLRSFEHEGVTFGCLIGNDLWVAPGFGPYVDRRLSYQLGRQGAQIIFHSNDSGTDPSYAAYYESNLRLRAKESGCHIVTVNAANLGKALNVPSGIVTPDGEWLVTCKLRGEHLFSFDIELELP